MGETTVKVMPTVFSDHAGLLIEVRRTQLAEQTHSRRAKLFKYENMWQRHGDYMEFVNKKWDLGAGQRDLHSVAASLGKLQADLGRWDRDVFGSVRKKLRHLRKELEDERSHTTYRGPTDRERSLMQELLESLAREEEVERQRSRVEWLSSGDRNTSFFQAKAQARARTNRIHALKRADGSEDQGLFTAQSELQPELVCQCVPRKVTDQMAELLCRSFTTEEVEAALFQMSPNKAPGADGFTAGFFQKHWPLLKDKVVSAVLGFLNGGDMPEVINQIILVLIPKVTNPQDMSQFRSISLCNVIYKLCSKVLANRLRLILDDVISEEQSAFVPGRLITDNVLIAYECIHYLKKQEGEVWSLRNQVGHGKGLRPSGVEIFI
jgi:hypothetical protein